MTESKNNSYKNTKEKTWIKFYPEKWIFGSTREEMTNAERAVWMDILSLAAMNDPLGQVDFISYKRLANQLNISVKLLKSTIKKAIVYEKIELIELKETQIGSNFREKEEIIDPTCDQLDNKNANLVTTQTKFGLSIKSIIILKWNKFQSEYMRQKPYRAKKIEREKQGDKKTESLEKLQNSESEIVNQVTHRGEEKGMEENREKTLNQNRNYSLSPLPSDSNSFNKGEMTKKDQFLSVLKDCDGYPLDEVKDSLLFDITIKECHGINILKQTEKKIAWWKKHPDALKSKKKHPREQLQEWFKEETKFKKRGGPQPIGEIMEGMDDPDHRRFLKQLYVKPDRRKKDNSDE